MEVKNTLAGVGTAVVDDPIARVGDSGLPGGAGGEQQEVAEKLAVLCLGSVERSQVPARDDQEMHRGLRVQIVENYGPVVLENDACRCLTGGNPTEDAVTHGRLTPH